MSSFDPTIMDSAGGIGTKAVHKNQHRFDGAVVMNAAMTFGAAGSFNYGLVQPTFGAAVTIDPTLGSIFEVIANAATAPTIGSPGVLTAGRQLWIKIKNTSGGAMGATTFNAIYKLGAAWANPANGFSRTIMFISDGTNLVEAFRSAADVAN